MKLIYYLPNIDIRLATVDVSKNILKYLTTKDKEIPFDKLYLLTPNPNCQFVKEIRKDSNIEIIPYKTFDYSLNNYITHIPVSPVVIPNKKLALYLTSVIKSDTLIMNYHGDYRKELQFDVKQKSIKSSIPQIITSLPTYLLWPYILKSADKLIVNSQVVSNFIRANYDIRSDIVIPNGLEEFWLEKSDNIREIKTDGKPKILYHGRLVPQKGIKLLIEAFSKTFNNDPKAKLYITGIGSQENYLRSLCLKLKIDKQVVFLGFVDDLKSLMNDMDAAIYPSIYEPFSIAILEAFSQVNGPVYYSSLAGINDFVLQKGYSLNSFYPNVENIVRIMQEISQEAYDKKVIEKQRMFAKECTWDKTINQYIRLYKSVI